MRSRRIAVAFVLVLAFIAAGQAGAQPCLIFVHGTRAWRLDQVTARPYDNPGLLDAAARLESSAAQ